MYDYLLACFFLFCLGGNISVDIWMGMDIDLNTTGYEFHKIVYDSGIKYDPLFVDNSPYMRWSAFITAIVYAPYYVIASKCLFYGQGLGNQNSFIRTYSFYYAYGMFINMSIVLYLELKEYYNNTTLAPSLGFYWIPCGAYWIVPLLIIIRMRKEDKQYGTIKNETEKVK